MHVDADAMPAMAALVIGQRTLAHPVDRDLEEIAGAHACARLRALGLFSRKQSIVPLLLLARRFADDGATRHVGPITVNGAADIEAHEIAAGQFRWHGIGIGQCATLTAGYDHKSRHAAAGAHFTRDGGAQLKLGHPGSRLGECLVEAVFGNGRGAGDLFDFLRKLGPPSLQYGGPRIEAARAHHIFQLFELEGMSAIKPDTILRFYSCRDGGAQRLGKCALQFRQR